MKTIWICLIALISMLWYYNQEIQYWFFTHGTNEQLELYLKTRVLLGLD
jgi:hypothetical protein